LFTIYCSESRETPETAGRGYLAPFVGASVYFEELLFLEEILSLMATHEIEHHNQWWARVVVLAPYEYLNVIT
jgi:hypothetical protein